MDTWEAGFLQGILFDRSTPLTPRQRTRAVEITEKYEHESRGEQEVKYTIPPGKERYFRR